MRITIKAIPKYSQALDNLGGFLFPQYKLRGVELCLAARLDGL